MADWRAVAAASRAKREGGSNTETLAADTFGLPPSLFAEITRLESMPPPRKLEQAGNWRGVVTDAMTIAREGWAAKAMALGWNAGDLFGVGPRDDWDFQGLAVWLDGSRMLLLDERKAVAIDRLGERRYFVRGGMRHGTHPTIEPVMLWDFGR